MKLSECAIKSVSLPGDPDPEVSDALASVDSVDPPALTDDLKRRIKLFGGRWKPSGFIACKCSPRVPLTIDPTTGLFYCQNCRRSERGPNE